jgi:short-subunit dehydrogenase
VFTVTVSVFARVSLETAVSYVADFRNAPRWQRGLTAVEVAGPFPGSDTVVEVRRFLGRRIEAPGVLVDWDPGKGFTVRGNSGPLRVESRYGFAREADGTRISLNLTMCAAGLARVSEPLLRHTLERELNTAFERLGSILDGSPDSENGVTLSRTRRTGNPAGAMRAAHGKADLRGRTALVTGASRGLGFLIARELAEKGCRLALCARTATDLDRAARDLRARGAVVVTMTCDVSDQTQAEEFVRMAGAEIGPPDILVNNAGHIRVGPLSAMERADFDDALGVMFWGTVHTTLAVLGHMRERQSGSIVNIASIAGKMPIPHLLPYTCAKSATVGFSEGLRAEVARDGIKVTTVLPGMLRTGSHLRATYKGDPAREFAWFALGSGVPLASMNAERAARRIVTAMRRGRTQVILPAPAVTAVWLQALFPGVMAIALRKVSRLLPQEADAASADGLAIRDGLASQDGHAVREREESRLRQWATRLSDDAARRFNQLRDE